MFHLFKKKVTLFDEGSKEVLDRKEKLLHDAGIWTNTWSTFPAPVIGGPHMKSQDWSGKKYENKDEQRVIYHLEVLAADQYKAMKLLLEDGGVDVTDGN